MKSRFINRHSEATSDGNIKIFYIILAAALLLLGRASGATYTAASSSWLAVSNALVKSHDGDTVIVPAGESTWTGGLIISNNITLQGAGSNSTIITDDILPSNFAVSEYRPPILAAFPNTNGALRITGFTFKGSTDINTHTNPFFGRVRLGGTNWMTRIDHCVFTNLFDDNLYFDGWVYGVVDHCSFVNTFKVGVTIWHYYYGGGLYGDASWADDERLGGTNVVCVEDCFFNDLAQPSSATALDMYAGARAVFRYNVCSNTAATTHGTDTTGRARSFRLLEIYKNLYLGIRGGSTSAGQFRGGTGLYYSNTLVGDFGANLYLTDYRATAQFGYWVWALDDTNPPTLTGRTVTSFANNVMTDSGANWDPDQWKGYTLRDMRTVTASFILGNDATTITTQPYGGDGTPLTMSSGDPYTIIQINSLIDQPGRGKGHMLTNNTDGMPYDMVTGHTNYPAEAIEPVYAWSNNINGVLSPIGSIYPTIKQGRDYYNQMDPSYTPLVYPHPLVVPEITTVVGTGTAGYSGDGGPALSADLWGPTGISFSPSGDLLIADSYNETIRKVSGGVISSPLDHYQWYGGDFPVGVVMDANGYYYIADPDWGGVMEIQSWPSIRYSLGAPWPVLSVALNSSGKLICVDMYGNTVSLRNPVPDGSVTGVAGDGDEGYSGDGGSALSASLDMGLGASATVDGQGNIYIADRLNNVIRKVSGGNISTSAGDYDLGAGYSGDGGYAVNAQLQTPSGVAVDTQLNLYIADSGNNVIRRVDHVSGKITTVAGTGTAGYSGDGGAAVSATLNNPVSLAIDASGNLYISDSGNNVIRKVTLH